MLNQYLIAKNFVRMLETIPMVNAGALVSRGHFALSGINFRAGISRLLAALVLVSWLFVPTAHGQAECVITGSIDLNDRAHAFPLDTDGTASTCAVPKSCPGPFPDENSFSYDLYTFVNTTAVTQCYTVTFDGSGCGDNLIFSYAYLNFLDDADICTNYLADGGVGTTGAESYSFNVPAGARFWILVEEFAPNTGCPSYSLTIDPCPPTPTAADSSISGRITTRDGTALSGTVISFNGPRLRRTITDSNGFYSIDQLETGAFYTLTPFRANYLFNPLSLSFSLLGNKTDAFFTAEPTAMTANPLDTDMFFVRQQYLDFFGREPDPGGLAYWTEQINACGIDATCISRRRSEVSAAFFIEQEFQRTGSFIYGLYKGSLSRRPGYAEFSADRRQVVEGPTLEATKQALAESFVSRAEFTSKYQGNNSAESFVDALLGTVSQSSGIDLSSERANLISRYQAGANLVQSRSIVLRDVIENAGFRQAEYNRAFVLAEYFGYLQRDPDQGGYDFWLDVVSNRDVNNYRSMVCAFISSAEYQRRFSSIVSRNDRDCG